MDDDTIQDLKQFIASTISQATTSMVTKDDLKDDLAVTNKKIGDGFAAIGEAIENTNESTATQLNDHEQRIGRLEQKAA